MSDNKEKTEGMMLEEQLVWKFPHIGKDAPEQVEAAKATRHFWMREKQRGNVWRRQ